jgi:pyridoxal phosphate enzyme (YggS family)
VTKTVPPEVIREAVALGLTELGESRVQEARAKQVALGSTLQAQGRGGLQPPTPGLERVRWHLVGHLQSNKAKLAAELFDVIHSVDSLALVQALGRSAQRRPTTLEVLIQVNVSGEPAKFGCRPEEASGLVRAARGTSGLTVCGLMTIPPLSHDPEAARPYFRRLRRLRDDVAAACGVEPSTLRLSMGMSQDFEVAIEEGADLIRVGTALFGGS